MLSGFAPLRRLHVDRVRCAQRLKLGTARSKSQDPYETAERFANAYPAYGSSAERL